MTLIFDLVGQGHLCFPFLMMWRYMSKSASSNKYLISFIKLNFSYLSIAENNNLSLSVLSLNLYIVSASPSRLVPSRF